MAKWFVLGQDKIHDALKSFPLYSELQHILPQWFFDALSLGLFLSLQVLTNLPSSDIKGREKKNKSENIKRVQRKGCKVL